MMKKIAESMHHSSPLGLRNLVSPVGVERFVAELWERDSHLSRLGSNETAGLFAISHVWDLSNSLTTCSREWLRLVKDGAELPEEQYRSSEGLVDISKVARAFDKGFTIQLSRLHKRFAPLGKFCRALEQDFIAAGVRLINRIGAHCYLTPPNSRAMDIHCDYHDVFVVQIQGVKRWKVWQWTDRYPIEQTLERATDLPDVKWEIDLTEGDILYIPRGVFHGAWTVDNPSLHIALSVYPLTFADILTELIKEIPEARAPLFPDASETSQTEQIQASITHIMQAFSSPAAVSRVINNLGDRLLERLDPLPNSSIECGRRELETLDATTRMRRTSIPFILCEEDEQVILKWRDGRARGSRENANAFRFLAKRRKFQINELPLESGDAVRLSTELLKVGLFEVDPITHIRHPHAGAKE